MLYSGAKPDIHPEPVSKSVPERARQFFVGKKDAL